MALGTAPRRIAPGVWKTRTGQRLTPDQVGVWEHYYRTGHTDGLGHWKTTPSVLLEDPFKAQATPTVQPMGAPPKKPSRETQVRASTGDLVAKRAVTLWNAHKASQASSEAQRRRLEDVGLFGSAVPDIYAASKTINPVAGSLIASGSPTTWFPHVGQAIHGQGVNPLGIGTDVALALFPFGKAGKVLQAGKAARAARLTEEELKALPPEEQVLRTTGAARRLRTEQNKLVSAERGKRAGQLGPAFEAAGGGRAGHQAALAELKGELPTLRFDQLTHLDDNALDRLMTIVQQHTDLRPYEKISLQSALLRMTEGHAPRPFEIKLVERAFGPESAMELGRAKSFTRKVLHAAGEVANLPRSILASADVSAPFRQGLLAGAANPRLFAKNLGPMFQMFASEKRYGQVMQEIADRPSYPTMLDAKLKLTDLGDLTTREEQFMSNLAEKITGGKYGIVRASSRAYTGFLNRMRADLFDHLVDAARSQGIETPKLRRDVARFVNVATGRGELGPLEPAAVVLNSVLFSPRLFASRINALNPLFYASLDPFARKQAVSAMVKLVGAGMTVLTLAKLAGAKVNTDPRNSDFGKLKVGNTRFDIWGGHQQIVRLFSQVASGQIVSSTTGKTLRLKGGYNLSRQDITKRFFEGKLAPTPSLINDWFKGTDFADRPFSWKREVVSRSYPLLIQDALDIYHGTESPWKALGGYGIGAFGIGVQTYGPRPPKKKPSRAKNSGNYWRGGSVGSSGGGTSYWTR